MGKNPSSGSLIKGFFSIAALIHIKLMHWQVFCGKIPRDVYESDLIPLFEKCGTIWDLRLMMDPMTGLNRGYAFVTFTTREAAQEAVRQVQTRTTQHGNTHTLKSSTFVVGLSKQRFADYRTPPYPTSCLRSDPKVAATTQKVLILGNCSIF